MTAERGIRLIQMPAFPNEWAGSFIPMLVAVLEAAREHGWTVDVVLPEEARGRDWLTEFESREIPVRFLSGYSRLRLAPRVAEILSEHDGPTVLHTHFTRYDVPAVLAARRHPSTSVFWHVHTVLPTGPLGMARNALKFSTLGRMVDGMLCPAENISAGVVQRLGPSDRVAVLPSPIDVSAFVPPSDARKRAARAELGVPEEGYALLHFGRAWRLKGGDIFLEVVKVLRDQGLPVYGIVNRGGDPARSNRDELGLADHVHVLGPMDDVHVLFAAADCFVAPSRGEGMPYAIVEALASGTPVVASELPGHDYVAGRVETCQTTSSDPAVMAVAVREFLERDPAIAKAQVAATRAWIESHLSVGVIAAELLEIYERALRGDPIVATRDPSAVERDPSAAEQD